MKNWDFYTSKELKPDGWIRRQLEIQARGLSGNLDKIWRDVKESRWIGGEAEGWERVPYWLDGFIPLAYLLEDEDMILRARKYIDGILAQQQEDGWICPCKKSERATYDSWAVMLVSKILLLYYECSGDERIPDVIYRMMRNYYELLKSGIIRLFGWGKHRWFEGFIVLDFLHKKYGDVWICECARLLKKEGADYDTFVEVWRHPKHKWTHETHVVNVNMSLRGEALSCELLGETYSDMAEKHYQILKKESGTATDIFVGDECLGPSDAPTRGSELCSVVELMYSYEHLFAYSGDTKWLERLAVVAFNALPATIDDDMWTHQYDQLANQVACVKPPVWESETHFSTNAMGAMTFGLEPFFGCCTANMAQGWPKLLLSAFMHRDNVIISTLTIPSVLDADKAKIKLETNYPFENSMKYTIDSKEDFDFCIVIPSFAQNLKINGEDAENGIQRFKIKGGEHKEIAITFEVVPYFEDRPSGLKTVKYGSLVFSLPIQFERIMREYTENGVVRRFPYCDYDLVAKSNWNYAYTSDQLKVIPQKIDAIPFSSKQPPIVIETKGVNINWGINEKFPALCARVPESTTPIGEEETIILYPYGATKLRMTELPKI